jgi:hypothetical protein
MKKYVRIKFSNLDFFDFRFGGPGLGNLLFVWARAIVYADKFSLPILSPNWRTFKIGTYLRFEIDKRTYTSIFIKNGIKGFKKYLIQLYSIQQIQNSKIKSFLNIPEVIIFSGMKNQMTDIINDHILIKKTLYSILSEDVIKLIDLNNPISIGVHIRFGDFQPENENLLRLGKTNTRIPINWYITQINKLKQKFGNNIHFKIFSDGSIDELSQVLSIENVMLVQGGNSLSDLVSLSQSKIIISSNSTFSLWASYLGRCHTIWFPGTKRFDLFKDNESCIEFELDYDQKLPENLKL